jgi:hypothetical protein
MGAVLPRHSVDFEARCLFDNFPPTSQDPGPVVPILNATVHALDRCTTSATQPRRPRSKTAEMAVLHFLGVRPRRDA